MFKMNLQLFAHKKGVGSTKNGRDSEAKRLGAKRAVCAGREYFVSAAGNQNSSRSERRPWWR